MIKKMKKVLTATSLAMALTCSPISQTASILNPVAVEAAAIDITTGCFASSSNWSGRTYYTVGNSRKSSKLKFCAFKMNGAISGGKFYVEVYGGTKGNENYVGTFSFSGSGSLSLNYGYPTYSVRFKRNGTGATNVSCTQYWSIDSVTNISRKWY